MFPTRATTALAPVLLVLAVSAACGGDDSEFTPASTREERAALCAKLDTKKCNLGSAGAPGCEIRLEGASQPVVDSLDACITQSTTPCKEAWKSCLKNAFEERAPGHPNVPSVTSCKAKNTECTTKYRPTSTDRDNTILRKAIDAACDAIVALDGVTEGHARECQAKDCDAFSTCILDASIDVDAAP